jgi:hypothetical protein
MADPNTPSLETSEEVLASEISDLEKRTLNSAWLWVTAAVGLVVFFSATFLVTNWGRSRSTPRLFNVAPEAMLLKEPVGTVDRTFTFRWNRVQDATSYILMVTARDRGEVELLRPVRETYLTPSETEIANLNPGAYAWTIEARSSQGQLIGYGEASFTISGGD